MPTEKTSIATRVNPIKKRSLRVGPSLPISLTWSINRKVNVQLVLHINSSVIVLAFVYHGTVQSSTSSDISPMSEQKSLPRRNRNRWEIIFLTKWRKRIKTKLLRFLSQGGRSGSQRHILSHLSVAETAFSESTSPGGPGGQIELSEAECDIDTLKKLKLGLRSSLWSRPQGGQGGQQPPSDYSIAVWETGEPFLV